MRPVVARAGVERRVDAFAFAATVRFAVRDDALKRLVGRAAFVVPARVLVGALPDTAREAFTTVRLVATLLAVRLATVFFDDVLVKPAFFATVFRVAFAVVDALETAFFAARLVADFVDLDALDGCAADLFERVADAERFTGAFLRKAVVLFAAVFFVVAFFAAIVSSR